MPFKMHNSLALIIQLILASSVAVFAIPTAEVSTSGPSSPQAVYYMTNEASGNSIGALAVNADGTVKSGTTTPTGGKGGRAPSTILTDALNSQSPVQRIGQYLLAVNAGSNTVSMFQINPSNPLQLTQLGAPVTTLGDFPTSIAVSAQVPNLACVANCGTRSGIACYKMTPRGLQLTDTALRPLPLTPTQSTPPTGPFNTVSQILFNYDGSELWATVKGDPSKDNPGYFGSFPVQNGVVSHNLTQSSPAHTAALFGSVPLPGNKVFTADPTFGVVALQVSPNGVATTENYYVIANNNATCWSAISPATGLVYTVDDGTNHINSFDPYTANPKAQTIPKNNIPSMIGISAWGSLLYTLTPGDANVPPAIVVLQTNGASGAVTQVQRFAPAHVTDNIEGLAIYG